MIFKKFFSTITNVSDLQNVCSLPLHVAVFASIPCKEHVSSYKKKLFKSATDYSEAITIWSSLFGTNPDIESKFPSGCYCLNDIVEDIRNNETALLFHNGAVKRLLYSLIRLGSDDLLYVKISTTNDGVNDWCRLRCATPLPSMRENALNGKHCILYSMVWCPQTINAHMQ